MGTCTTAAIPRSVRVTWLPSGRNSRIRSAALSRTAATTVRSRLSTARSTAKNARALRSVEMVAVTPVVIVRSLTHLSAPNALLPRCYVLRALPV
jgi:hypothetical protein